MHSKKHHPAPDKNHSVLRKNAYLIATSLNVNDKLLDNCWNDNLLSLDQIDHINSSQSARKRNARFVEEILSNKNIDLRAFCRCIYENNSELAESFLEEFEATSASMIHDSALQKEATSMVFKVFGASRRMSECDKKQIANLVCLNATRAVQSEMKENLILKEELKRLKIELVTGERMLGKMLNRLDECVNENPFLMKTENLVDTRTTSDAILQMRKSASIEKHEPSKIMDNKINCLIDSYNYSFYGRKRSAMVTHENQTDKEAAIRKDKANLVCYNLPSPAKVDSCNHDGRSYNTSATICGESLPESSRGSIDKETKTSATDLFLRQFVSNFSLKTDDDDDNVETFESQDSLCHASQEKSSVEESNNFGGNSFQRKL